MKKYLIKNVATGEYVKGSSRFHSSTLDPLKAKSWSVKNGALKAMVYSMNWYGDKNQYEIVEIAIAATVTATFTPVVSSSQTTMLGKPREMFNAVFK